VLAGVLNFYGTKWIERFKTFGTTAIFIGYIIFALLVISNIWGYMMEVFDKDVYSYVVRLYRCIMILSLLSLNGYYFDIILDVWNYLSYNPSSLFTVKRQRSIKYTFIGVIIAGVLMTVPWFLTYFALMGNYSSTKVFDADVPWLQMLDGYGLWVTILFGLVVGWTLIE